ncbi:putative peptidoglycan lipid II flippase [Hydrogenivirga caldilitoris]|uniref:Probable lipid II flippase MurJ n=1 Tax=Hydrogenivirga caldilitoris TaxID=246264 RepID=A0A497XUI6_9AQUI|nr:murein biosynthesis integral membrane protein MurJ [Hydrogenivirga caldilitoris]RLJ70812.1 putative peptidoglycan lipid II flippase [Hydrogenivirga caldilitoris]
MRLVRFAFNFALGTLLSRVLGFLRDASIAYYFGATHIADAFFVAFRIPNSFRRLLGEGGFNAVFVPLYTKSIEEGRDRDFLSKVFTFYLLVNSLITLVGVLLTEYIVSLIAPGIRGSETFSLAVFMARFLFLYLLLVGLGALFMGILNVRGSFFIPAVSQGVFNFAFLVVLLLSADRYGHIALILGVLIGGVLQVLINVPVLVKKGVSFSLSFRFDEDVKLLLRRLIPALGGFGVNQLSLFIDTFLASFLRTGAIAYLYYANRLYQLPFGVVSVGIANSLLSILSRKDSNREDELITALRLILLLMIPASAGLFILSEDIIRVVYHRGSFNEKDVYTSARILSIYSLGLVFFSLQKSLSALFFSTGDTKTPVKASLLTVLSEGAFAATFAFLLGLGVFGLPMGTALSSLTGLSYLWVKTPQKPPLAPLFKTLLKSTLAACVMGATTLYIKGTGLTPLTLILSSIPLAIFIYFVMLLFLREELTLRLSKGFVKKLINP